jgi:hypothetical protein
MHRGRSGAVRGESMSQEQAHSLVLRAADYIEDDFSAWVVLMAAAYRVRTGEIEL